MFLSFSVHFWIASWRLKAVFIALVLMILAGAGLITYTEQLPFGDALYFALITGLTVGYGDIVAATAVGRIVSIFMGIIGIMFTGLVVAVTVHSVQIAMKEVHGTD
jgi:voltage-gated potassium channel